MRLEEIVNGDHSAFFMHSSLSFGGKFMRNYRTVRRRCTHMYVLPPYWPRTGAGTEYFRPQRYTIRSTYIADGLQYGTPYSRCYSEREYSTEQRVLTCPLDKYRAEVAQVRQCPVFPSLLTAGTDASRTPEPHTEAFLWPNSSCSAT